MERLNTTKEVDGGRIYWKNTSIKSSRLRIDGNKRIIKPGEVFLAHPNDVPMAFRDILQPLDGLKVVKDIEEKPVAVNKPLYEVKPHKAKGRKPLDSGGNALELFDVVNSSGKVINEKGLPKEVAERLKVDLEK